jgi:hypothetical protein
MWSNVASNMKTTIVIPDGLLAEAQALARREGTTLKALTQEGLRKVIAEKKSRKEPFKLRDASVGGKGLRPEFQGPDGCDRIRALIHEGRGG